MTNTIESQTTELASAMQQAHGAGVSIIPIDAGTKRPAANLLPVDRDTGKATWAPYQQSQAHPHNVDQWATAGVKAYAAIGGDVSGGLLVIDFDEPRFYDAWAKAVGDLLDGLTVQQTGGGGYQVLCRCDEPGGNLKLAWIEDSSQPAGRRVAIETRGEGGYAVLAPSLHPSGNRYRWLTGDCTTIPTISQAKADALLDAARKLDECPLTRQQREKMASSPVKGERERAGLNGRASVIDAFNDAHAVDDILEANGYRRSGDRMLRPGAEATSEPGVVMFTNRQGRRVSYHWSTNDPLNDGHAHDAFGLFCHFDAKGDMREAVRKAADLMGMGQPQPQPPRHDAPDQTPAADDAESEKTDKSGFQFDGAPIPLEPPPLPDMPAGTIPGAAGEMADAIARQLEVPLMLPGMLAVAVLATCSQKRVSVLVEPGYIEPTNLYVGAFLEPGNRKTGAFIPLLRPFIKWERTKREEMQVKIRIIESERATKQARIKSLRAEAAKADASQLTELCEQIAEMEADVPEVPPMPRVFTEDPTPEHLATMLSLHDERMGIFSDEGGLFENFAGRYANGVANIDVLLKSYSGSPARIDRGSRPAIALDHPLLSMGVSPQPRVLQGLMANETFRGRGLLDRVLYALPDSPLGYRHLEPRPIPDHIQIAYESFIVDLCDFQPGTDGHPHVLRLHPDAYETWKEHQREIEADMRPGERMEHFRGWASKLPGNIARLAGVFHVAKHGRQAPDHHIELETMAAALDLSSILVAHAAAAFDSMGANAEFEQARKLWRSVIDLMAAGDLKDGRFSLRDLWHRVRGTYKRVGDIEPGVEVLIEHRFIAESPNADFGKRGRPSRQFVVNPAAKGRAERC